MQGGGGNTTTGQTGRMFFSNPELCKRILVLVEDEERKKVLDQIMQNLAVMLRWVGRVTTKKGGLFSVFIQNLARNLC